MSTLATSLNHWMTLGLFSSQQINSKQQPRTFGCEAFFVRHYFQRRRFMNHNEVDAAPEQEHARKQILELLRQVAREMVRRIAATSQNAPRDAGGVNLKQGSAQ